MNRSTTTEDQENKLALEILTTLNGLSAGDAILVLDTAKSMVLQSAKIEIKRPCNSNPTERKSGPGSFESL